MDKPIGWLHGRIKSPPFSDAARIEAGFLLRQLQDGYSLGMPHSRPMPIIGPRCHELRIKDESADWRIIYRVDRNAILIVRIFSKQSWKTPIEEIRAAQNRLRRYDHA